MVQFERFSGTSPVVLISRHYMVVALKLHISFM